LVEEHDVEPPYSVRLRGPLLPRADTTVGPTLWRRDGTQLHGDRIVATGRGATPAHVDVELRSLDALVERGALIVLLDLAIVGGLWLAAVIADGGAGRWLRARRRTLGRSYRARLSFANCFSSFLDHSRSGCRTPKRGRDPVDNAGGRAVRSVEPGGRARRLANEASV
jgi:hypothetical protein